MAIGSKVSGQFKSASNFYAKVNGGWKSADFGYVKVEGTWKQFWARELTDSFGRANTASSLGSAESGQGWTATRGIWRILNNAANTTSAKSEYPLALINTGFNEFEMKANEISPGMGVAFRSADNLNWNAIVPYYTSTSYTYSVCVSGYNESYCIANCTTPAGYTQTCPSGEIPASTRQETTSVGIGCETVTVPESRVCGLAVPRSRQVTTCTASTTETYNCCIKTCNRASTTCVPGGLQCTREDGITRCVQRPQECTTTYSEICCDRDICTRTVPGTCTTSTEYYEECIYYETYPAYQQTTCAAYIPVTTTVTVPASCPGGYVQVPYYNCCQFGQRFVCQTAGTATGYNYNFYIRIISMVNGVVTNTDIETTERWNALKLSGNQISMVLNVYKDTNYTQLVKTHSFTNTSGSTNYGIIGAPSNYEDGRDIGLVEAKAFGQ